MRSHVTWNNWNLQVTPTLNVLWYIKCVVASRHVLSYTECVPHVRWPEPCDFVLAVLWFSHALTTDCIRLQLRIFRKHPPSNPHCHLCNLHHCDHVHQGCGTSFTWCGKTQLLSKTWRRRLYHVWSFKMLKIFFEPCLIYCSPACTWRWQTTIGRIKAGSVVTPYIPWSRTPSWRSSLVWWFIF